MTAPNPPRGPDGKPVFAAPWEAKVFALVLALHERGLFTWPEWSAALAREIADHADHGHGFFDHWLEALEDIVVEKRLASAPEIEHLREAWAQAAETTPHGQPIELPR